MNYTITTERIFIVTLLFVVAMISLFGNVNFLIQQPSIIQYSKQWSTPLQKDSLLIIPDPVVGRLRILVPSSATPQIWLGIYNAKGQLLKQSTFLSGKVLEISVREWAPAVYFIKIEDRNGYVWSSKYLKM